MRAFRPGFQLALRALKIADDDGEQIIEVVRNTAGELADRFELLRLPQPLFGRYPPIDFRVKTLGSLQYHSQGQEHDQGRRAAEREVREDVRDAIPVAASLCLFRQ